LPIPSLYCSGMVRSGGGVGLIFSAYRSVSQRPRSWHLAAVFVIVAAVQLAGCGKDTNPASGIRQVDDPAMQTSAAMPTVSAPIPVTHSQSSANDDMDSRPDPDKPFVDLDARRIYLPESGWLEGDDFLDLYLNRPEELPGDVDLYAVHELANLLMSQEI